MSIHNYFDDLTKFFFYMYLAKFLNTIFRQIVVYNSRRRESHILFYFIHVALDILET